MAHRRGYRVTSMHSPASKLPEPNRVSRLVGSRSRAAVVGSSKDVPDLRPVPNGQPPLDEYYNSMFTAFGPQHWWPGKTQFEVIVGAILTQNTSWTNVERAISNLRNAGLLSPLAIEEAPLRRLERMIRSSGYFRQKARKLKAFCKFLRGEFGGSLKRMFETPTIVLREKLLGVFGIGPETADSILLYAGDHPVFVVDAYTKRMLTRHGWIHEKAKYEDVRWMFERDFPGDVKRFNEFHALIVNTGKNFCRTHDPLCGECPLGRYLEEGR
jgi:endonuclease-3 related protein